MHSLWQKRIRGANSPASEPALKFGRVLLNLFFSGETLGWADAF
jgi:hypothetical protein